MTGLERKLARWKAAGLIDDGIAEAIVSFERRDRRPVTVWVVASLALLALALGVVLLVGANWDRIPACFKLAVQFAAMMGAAATVADGLRRGRQWQTEAALFLLAVAVLAGIALQGQIYQQAAPLWQPLAFWIFLCGPALLLLGRTWLAGSLFSLMLGALMLALAFHGFDHADAGRAGFLGAAGAIPFVLVGMASWRQGSDSFRTALVGFGLLYVLFLASLAHAAWSGGITAAESREALKALGLPLLTAGAAIAAASRLPPGERRVLRTIVIFSFAASAAALVTPHESAWYWRLAGVVLFCAMWGSIIRVAAVNGHMTLYRIGVVAIAARLIIVYFELFGSLALTGLGLIAGGVLVLALLAILHRAKQRLHQGGAS